MTGTGAEDLTALAAAIGRGHKGALAGALARLESDPDGERVLALLDAAWRAPRAEVIGLTGPPGVGKSTLTGALITALRGQGRTVAVIAVDPSSRRSGGALLGDRVRLATDPEDTGVFVRSMAARDRLGGLAGLTVAAMVLMRALYDVVLVETVGVGQSETDVVSAVDTVVFCVQPGSGDSLQFMKAGIVEIPHIIAVTKADMGAAATRARTDVAGALGLAEDETGWRIPVLALSALQREGITALVEALTARARFLSEAGRLVRQRHRQAEAWLADEIRDRWGREGLKRAGPLTLPQDEPPFGRLKEVVARLRGWC
ncbi:MAG: methylmalonyl Co-A mutase-associated GTPase MeaB [Rhodospirillaceae bacterium]